mmetsp:Transcript_101820/g.185862  ORF Transcript_101820/g.185862 Transcript_101820/m.185862 type:complete len:1271 (+) Transcript_101820:229-4041(+)
MEDESSEVTNVIVAVRCRPMSNKEKNEGQSECVEFPSDQQVTLTDLKGEPHTYAFDFVFSPTTPQDHIFERLGHPLIDKAFGGYNSTIFAYGQTGSGKTHTMLNHRGGPEERGLIPRINQGLFDRINTLTAEHETRRFLVCCSFLEIYNEIISDLLVPRSKQAKGGGLEIREQKGIGLYVKDLTEVVVETPDKLNNLIEQGFENRKTAATKMNDASSRSHCIFVIKLHQKDASDESKNTFSKVNLVDLAGSERAKSTEAEGERLKEGANINKSLSALGNVINALSSMGSGSKKVFVPYRNSKLTRVLQESLGGNSLCTMVAAMSPANTNCEETLSTLNYARRAKSIKVQATKNDESSQIKKLEDEVNALKLKLQDQACAAANASMSSKEKQELESRYVNQIEELQSFMKQSWDDKAKLSEQYEQEQARAKERALKDAERVRNERQRKLQLLENKGDIELSLQALLAIDSKLVVAWPDKVHEALGVEKQLRTQLHAVRLFRKSAGADFSVWWGRKGSADAAVELTLLSQVHTKLGSMNKELDALSKLEVQLEEYMGQIAPQVGLALRDAQEEAEKAAKAAQEAEAQQPRPEEELVEILSLVQRQLVQYHAKARSFLRDQRLELGFATELPWLVQSLDEDGASPSNKRKSLVDALKAEAECATSKAPREVSAEPSSGDLQVPSVLGLSTLECPNERISASSNAEAASCARLLQVMTYGGWCPKSDSADEYLEVDLGKECRVTAFSLQGREPCTTEWQQTRDLLRLAIGLDAPLPSGDKLPHAEKFFKRPPVRLVHDVGVALGHHKKCFGSWEMPTELLSYGDLSRDQKVAFFDALIKQTNECWPNLSVTLTTQDILSGKNCDESNRLLQLLAYLSLGSGSGLGDAEPQWVASWKLEYFVEGGWRWFGASDSEASALEGNTDSSGVKFITLSESIIASKVRIHPLTWHKHPGLRCEVHIAPKDSVVSKTPRPGDAASKGGTLEECIGLLEQGISEVQRGIQERQAQQQAENEAKDAEVHAAKDKAEQERDLLDKRLKEALARVVDLEQQHASATEKVSETETALLKMTVERDRVQAQAEQLDTDLAAKAEGKSAVEEQLKELHEDHSQLKTTLEDVTSQLDVMTEERDLARTKEEELFDLYTLKEEELMDTNNGYVYLTERLQEKEEEMEGLDDQVRKLQEANEGLNDRCKELQSESLELRVELQATKAKNADLERMHKAAQDRYVQVMKDKTFQDTASSTPTTSAPAEKKDASADNAYDDDFDESEGEEDAK